MGGLVRELNPPAGLKEPIDWMLWTSLPVRTLEEAMEVIGYYEKRWVIEEWHKALKTGCQVERRQLKTSHRLEALTGLLSVVAVRLMQLKEMGRREPQRAAMELAPHRYVELVHRWGGGRSRAMDDPGLLPRGGRAGWLLGSEGRRGARLDHDLAWLGGVAQHGSGCPTRIAITHLVNKRCG